MYTPVRRRRWRPYLPWVVALALLAAAGWHFRRTLADLYHEHMSDQVRVQVMVTPVEARVELDGTLLEGTSRLLPRSSALHLVRIQAAGYRTEAFHVRALESQTYQVTLHRARAKGARPPADHAARCPAGMQRIEVSGDGFCVDRYEYPGQGKLPAHGVNLNQARSACHARGARLCSVEEWLQACGERFPYGARYDARRCNTGGEALVPAGARRHCRSRRGVYDLSGNVSEWVKSGVAMGGDLRQTDGMASCRASSDAPGPFAGFRCCADLPWD